MKSSEYAAMDAIDLAAAIERGELSAREVTDKAIEELSAARALDPDDGVIAYELGVALALSGDVGGAADALDEAGRLDPEDGWARVVLGLVLLDDEDRWDEATASLVTGARLRPEDDDVGVHGPEAHGKRCEVLAGAADPRVLRQQNESGLEVIEHP